VGLCHLLFPLNTYEKNKKGRNQREKHPFMVYWNSNLLLEKKIESTMELTILHRENKKMAMGRKKKKIWGRERKFV
jgi:hypothetical protein